MSNQTKLQTERTVDVTNDPRLSKGTKAFLKILNSPAPPELEKLSPVEARQVLADAQASVNVDYSGIEKSEKTIFGRYRIEPQAGKEFLSADEIANAAPNYLSEEIRRRVAESPVRFNFRLQLAQSGDDIEDPSIAWSDENKIVELGVIEIASVVDDSIAAEHALLFLPAVLPDGIEPADPMIRARSNSYPIS